MKFKVTEPKPKAPFTPLRNIPIGAFAETEDGRICFYADGWHVIVVDQQGLPEEIHMDTLARQLLIGTTIELTSTV